MSKVGEYYREQEEMLGPNEDLRPEEDPISNCCGAQFGYPGWPDNDICSECNEHAEFVDEEESPLAVGFAHKDLKKEREQDEWKPDLLNLSPE